jgi:hypothetical protein
MYRSIAFLFLFFFGSFFIPSLEAYTWLGKSMKVSHPKLLELDTKYHDVNAVLLMVSNQGIIGNTVDTGGGRGFFPSSTNNNYVFGCGLWFGAQYDADDDGDLDKVFSQGYNPLAANSEFREGRGDQDRDDPLTRVFDSTESGDLAEWPPQFSDSTTGDPLVYSDQDLVTTYTTQDEPPEIGDFQLPLDVNQRSMALISGNMAQVIFFVFDVIHTGDQVLEDAWIGFDSDMDIGQAFSDDLSSFFVDRIKTGDDTVKLDLGFAWDSDFTESNFVGDPGFVGVSFLLSPGNPGDGIDNDGDGQIDESPFNGIDDDGDSYIDEYDEVDEIGLVNYSKHCNPSAPCEVLDPQADDVGYDLLNCDAPGDTIECLESTTPGDVRFMLSSGPFDWQPGQTQKIALAMVFAHPSGDLSLDFVGIPPRPNPDDDDLVEFLEVAEEARDHFSTLFPPVGIGDDTGGEPGIMLPKTFALHQNYPNPFNPFTTIKYEVSGESNQLVDLSVFDLRGQLVRSLVIGHQPPGSYEINWDGKDRLNQTLPSGTYLYRLKVGDFISIRKMSIVK